MTVFLHSRTQKALDTSVLHHEYLPPGVGAAGTRYDRPYNLAILRFKARLYDVMCSICQFSKKSFHTADGPVFYSEG